MGFLFALLAVFGENATSTIDKLNYRRNHIAARELMFLVFFGMTISVLLFIIVTRQPLPRFSLVALCLVGLVALVSFAGNAFDYLSLKVDDLSLREPMLGFEPALAGLVGYLTFPAERKPGSLIAFVLAIFIAYWGTHRRKLRRRQKKGMTYLLLATICYGTQPSIYKLALVYISPAYMTLFRVAAILLLSVVFFRLGRQAYSMKKVSYGLVSGFVCTIGAVASLYAINTLGVVLTMLLMLLGPALMYLASYFILKEKVRTGEIISSGLLAAVVFGALII